MRKITTALSAVAVLAMGAQAASLEDRVKALESKNEVLTEEVLAAQSGGFTLVDTKKSHNGMGPAASKAYYSESPLSIGGYGEAFYANPDNGDDFTDIYRFITYFGYKFNDWIVLNAEIEFEHGADAGKGGAVVVEFLYLDFLLSDAFSLRVGNVLAPMGLINLRHEPTLFNTVQRPEIERQLIPSTWHENGVLAYGKFEDIGIEYTAGMINALNVNNSKITTPKSGWIRSGRVGTSKNGSFTPAVIGRVDYTGINGLMAGVSAYYGSASNTKVDADDINGASTTMFDIHARYENGPFAAYGLYTQSTVDGAEKLGTNVADKASGYYGNISYDIGSLIGLDYKMPIFAQYENWNSVEGIANQTDLTLNTSDFEVETTTIGLNFFPADQVVLKLDYEMNDDFNGEQNTISFGLGFIF